MTLPLGKLVAFVGVSGSGKSSLAFDTLYAEGRRRYLDALASVDPEQLPVPDVESIRGLPPTVGLPQRGRRPNPRWTLATFTGIHRLFQVLFRNDATLVCPGCGAAMNATPLDDMVSQVMAYPDGSRVFIEGRIRVDDASLALEEIARQGFSRVRLGEDVIRLDTLTASDVSATTELSVVVDRIRISSEKADRLYDALRLGLRVGGDRTGANREHRG